MKIETKVVKLQINCEVTKVINSQINCNVIVVKSSIAFVKLQKLVKCYNLLLFL